MDEAKTQLVKDMEQLNYDALYEGVKFLSANGCSTQEIEELLQQGMLRVGDRFAEGEYFLADLIVSGMMFRSVLELLGSTAPPQIPHENKIGRVLIGVVAGDIHDIGKDIVVQVLKTENFDVLNLGVDVTAEAFVQAAQNYHPDVIALSGIMSGSLYEMQSVIDTLTKAGIYPHTPLVVGGACLDDRVRNKIDAHCYAHSPIDTVKFCKNVVESKERNE